jgi:predicted phosphodiesterase
MMADVHGNAIALRKCLSHLRRLGAEEIVFLGDAVGYMPGESEVVELLQSSAATCLRGNHEEMLLSPERRRSDLETVYRLGAARKRLGRASLEALASWPVSREMVWAGRRALLVHGSPGDPLEGYLYPDTDLSLHADVPFEVVVTAHSHRPFIRTCGGKTFVNVGSVGLPRDRGDLGAFALCDPGSGALSVHRFEFDVDEVVAAYGDDLDASVLECLRREAADVEGGVLNA